MTEVVIGAGGWAYFSTDNALKKYSGYFRSVEVNSTFYTYPSDSTLRSWRRRVPSGFGFSVKAHQDITHYQRFAPIPETYQALAKVKHECEMLDASAVIFQCPPDLILSNNLLTDFQNLFSSYKLGRLICLEIRTHPSDPNYSRFVNLLDDLGFIQVVDISRTEPTVQSDVLYTRIFGTVAGNRYQFSDKEIVLLHDKVHKSEWKKAFMVFHTIGMYSDAARMQNYETEGTFLAVSGEYGVDSVLAVLGPDSFPAWRKTLIAESGWKLCDWNRERRIRLSDLFQKIPEKLYLSRTELVDALNNLAIDQISTF